MEKLRGIMRPSGSAAEPYRVVAHRPLLRVLSCLGVAVVVVAAAVFGYWFAVQKSGLDQDYLAALEARERAQQVRIEALNRELANAELAQSVDAQATGSLRDTISELHDRVASLREEVTFYKSLMAPSSIERGLQIAEFDLGPGESERQFTYHVLLTQAEERRSWIQGDVRVEVEGMQPDAAGNPVAQVLALSTLAELESYPLRFRFRYFQDISGTFRLPEGFRPRSVTVTAIPKGNASDRIERTFDWQAQSG